MLMEEWTLLPQEMLHQLVLSMRGRCEATIANREGPELAKNGQQHDRQVSKMVVKLVTDVNLVTKNYTNLTLSPRFGQVPIE
ncbi:hypothetical protein TNCV_5116041 [Trichonephila clavipes]|nr:hypothetical protein TNCV_5116041 [Trichonephila clavipes]